MNSREIREKFFHFFASKKHVLHESAPIVIKNDPTLLFVNAGMNQFKDIFLGNNPPLNSRVINSQKCLRVSGKHNDLEEVGHDTYHHTMFEMLGNWSFGDYFKKEAIHLAWEFLTKELNISEERLYITFFEGDLKEQLDIDEETRLIWGDIIDANKIIPGNKKDNFWEMGKVGPCGPSTEIHIDFRSDADRKKIKAKDLINKDHPEVIEIWNIVFIEFNRKEDNSLALLPQKHVDTGMGFERLCMVMQNKTSTYDTDVFFDLIKNVSKISNTKYGDYEKTDIAIRVIVDHIRAISFAISDGQLPSNTGAGYVIRRILRRAVRYGYTYLNLKDPFLYQLVDVLAGQFYDIFPEIDKQKKVVSEIIKEEEKSFLKTLGKGLDLINYSINLLDPDVKQISGKKVFELYDTYGFPPDLTALILKEKGLSYKTKQFEKSMQEQKNRSRSASEISVGDWVPVNDVPIEGFAGYDQTMLREVLVVKYRKVNFKGKVQYHLVFNKTPFYPEGGGQIGDSGTVCPDEYKDSSLKSVPVMTIIDTKTENNTIIHITNDLAGLSTSDGRIFSAFRLCIDKEKRSLTSRNHSATHILHYSLRSILGEHVEQRGSYVGSDYLRFDFSHFQKIEKENLLELETEINRFIVEGVQLDEERAVPIDIAQARGAIGLFGEKYGDKVRVIQFLSQLGLSIELCGGTHVSNTSEIGLFKIISESSIASGVRRIEAVTSIAAIQLLNKKINILNNVQTLLKNSDNIVSSLQKIINENRELNELAKDIKKQKLNHLMNDLDKKMSDINHVKVLVSEVSVDASQMKDICFYFLKKYNNAFLALITKKGEKVILNIGLSKDLVEQKSLNANQLINQVGKHINAKGGGQPFFAVASGNQINGIPKVFSSIEKIITNL
ncbi:MAG: alanine--tRNA ligase [Flavobacteriales bacterium]|nr:alanine--tRNA ligase [Flavobacteriales bacterium]